MWQSINDNIVISSAEPEQARIKFKCSNCGRDVITEEMTIPVPNFQGDKAEESRVYSEELVSCSCGEDHEIQISNDYGGVNASINGVDANDIFIEPV